MATDPPVVTVLRRESRARIVLVCEHASNFIPPDYNALGLPASELNRHIAWDIGAEGLARRLSALLDAPAFLAGWSRLLIDGNRPPGAPSSIPTISEATPIPGNTGISAEEAETRRKRFFLPFHDALSACLEERIAAGVPTAIVGVHSFTPVYLGVARPWHAGILFNKATDWGRRVASNLDRPDQPVAENQPYQIEDASDYLIPVQAERRGLPAILLEIRQDLLATPADQDRWAAALAPVL